MNTVNTVFEYAKKQILGMQFERFSYQAQGKRYRWDVSPVMTCGLQKLLTLSERLTRVVFYVLVKEETV